MLDFLLSHLQNLPKELIVFILSMTPFIELRGGIVAGYLYGFSLYKTLIISILGNLIPIPLILLFIQHIFRFMKKHNILTGFIDKVTHRALKKSDKVANVEFWGLTLFVGIPLPATGAWTGALIASLLNIDVKQAIKAICLGLIMAATIMSLLTYGIINFVF